LRVRNHNTARQQCEECLKCHINTVDHQHHRASTIPLRPPHFSLLPTSSSKPRRPIPQCGLGRSSVRYSPPCHVFMCCALQLLTGCFATCFAHVCCCQYRYVQANIVALEAKKSGLHVVQQFDHLIVFSEIAWIGTAEDNPNEVRDQPTCIPPPPPPPVIDPDTRSYFDGTDLASHTCNSHRCWHPHKHTHDECSTHILNLNLNR
jgi:hypothetical protein